jgi:hypothetical protein
MMKFAGFFLEDFVVCFAVFGFMLCFEVDTAVFNVGSPGRKG